MISPARHFIDEFYKSRLLLQAGEASGSCRMLLRGKRLWLKTLPLAMRGGVATYQVDGCKLKMEFLPARVRITQSDEVGDCGFGANVTAAGSYRKIHSKKPKFDF